MKIYERQAKKTDEEIRKVNKMVAGINDGFSRMTEGFAIASIEEIFKKQKMYIDITFSRTKKRKKGKEPGIRPAQFSQRRKMVRMSWQ